MGIDVYLYVILYYIMTLLFFDLILIIVLIITPTTTANVYFVKVFLFILLILANIFLLFGFNFMNVNLFNPITTHHPVTAPPVTAPPVTAPPVTAAPVTAAPCQTPAPPVTAPPCQTPAPSTTASPTTTPYVTTYSATPGYSSNNIVGYVTQSNTSTTNPDNIQNPLSTNNPTECGKKCTDIGDNCGGFEWVNNNICLLKSSSIVVNTKMVPGNTLYVRTSYLK